MNIEIMPLLAEYVDQVHAIECACFSMPWSRQSFLEDVTNPMARYFILTEDGVPAAYIGVRIVLDELHIMNVAVSPECRRLGYSKRLIEELLVYAAQGEYVLITLEARHSNLAALNLYEGFGFERCGVRANYYEKPTEDAILMVKYL